MRLCDACTIPPRLPADVFQIAAELLAGRLAAAAALCGPADALQWCPSGSEVLGDGSRERLAAQAAVRLLALRQRQPGVACRLILFIATGQAGQQAVQQQVPQFEELQQLLGQCDAKTSGHISRSDASFGLAAEPIVASCGAETMIVTFQPPLPSAQVHQEGCGRPGCANTCDCASSRVGVAC